MSPSSYSNLKRSRSENLLNRKTKRVKFCEDLNATFVEAEEDHDGHQIGIFNNIFESKTEEKQEGNDDNNNGLKRPLSEPNQAREKSEFSSIPAISDKNSQQGTICQGDKDVLNNEEALINAIINEIMGFQM